MNYYKRHLGDYAKDTGFLSTYQHGVYALLLDWYYSQERAIPLDIVHRIVKARTGPEKRAVDEVVKTFFDVSKQPGFALCNRAEIEISNSKSKAKANSLIAKDSWDAKRMRNASDSHSELDATRAQVHKPLANNHKEQDQKIEQRAAQGGTRIPPDFHPGDDALRWAKAERPDIDALAETAAFVDHWTAKPGAQGRKTDWTATWRNWIRKAYANPRASPRTNPSANPMQSKTMQGIAALEAMKHENRTSTAVVSQLNFERPTKAALLGS